VDDGERVENQEPSKPEASGDAMTGTTPETSAEAAADQAVPAEPAAAAVPAAALPEAPVPPAKPHKRRRRRWIIAGSSVGAFIVVVVIAAFVAAHFTSGTPFCNSCHEMNPYYASWQTSTHKTAQCRDCHIPPGFVSYVKTKLGSLREIYVHVSGNPEAPISVTRKIPNASCFRCHDNPPADPSLSNVIFAHKTHSGIDCISCHVRLVHRSVTPPVYVDPATMPACLVCHNGSIAPSSCSTCHPVTPATK
jgi:nitrate/TMAO reductase-like tetraheme cytochrome c subunit